MHSKIKDLFEKKGITIDRLLKDCGIPESTYYSAVDREKLLSFKTMAKISDYFGVSLDYFKE